MSDLVAFLLGVLVGLTIAWAMVWSAHAVVRRRIEQAQREQAEARRKAEREMAILRGLQARVVFAETTIGEA